MIEDPLLVGSPTGSGCGKSDAGGLSKGLAMVFTMSSGTITIDREMKGLNYALNANDKDLVEQGILGKDFLHGEIDQSMGIHHELVVARWSLEAMPKDLGWLLPMKHFFNEDPLMEC